MAFQFPFRHAFQALWRRAPRAFNGPELGRKTGSLAFFAMTAIVSGFYVGWAFALAWFISAALLFLFGLPFLNKHLVAAIEADEPRRARGRRIFLVSAGSLFGCALWIAAWISGGAEMAFFAGLWVSGSLNFSFTYFSRDRILFFASAAPAVLAALLLPFMMDFSGPPAIFFALATLHALFSSLLSQRDITLLQARLMQTETAREAAEQANLAKSQFLATMSHELRTPLNAVMGYAEILEEDLTADGKADAAADAVRIRRAARDLLAMINETLDLSKIEAGRMDISPAETCVPAIIHEAVKTCAFIAQDNRNQVEVEIAPEIGALMLDGARLRQCLINLISNACKFTQDGQVRIEARLAGLNNATRTLIVEVRDTGCGISAADAEKLFQPFVQADSSFTRAHEGAGLGLVITRRLAQLMGGDVRLISMPGAGSTFTLTVAAREIADEHESGEAHAPLILVIEDEAAARDLIRRALARLPFRVRAAQNGADGLNMAREEKPALIVLDLNLPDQSGWDLLAFLKQDEALGETPVLIVSIEDDRARALSLGACDHLVKPVDRDQLAAAALRHARAPVSLTRAA